MNIVSSCIRGYAEKTLPNVRYSKEFAFDCSATPLTDMQWVAAVRRYKKMPKEFMSIGMRSIFFAGCVDYVTSPVSQFILRRSQEMSQKAADEPKVAQIEIYIAEENYQDALDLALKLKHPATKKSFYDHILDLEKHHAIAQLLK